MINAMGEMSLVFLKTKKFLISIQIENIDAYDEEKLPTKKTLNS